MTFAAGHASILVQLYSDQDSQNIMCLLICPARYDLHLEQL